MKLHDIVKKSFQYGTNTSRDNFLSFAIKIISYIIPAIALGHYTDQTIQTIQNHKLLGNNIIIYGVLQLFINIITLYILIRYFTKFASEFQQSIAGSYFIVIYFGMQTNYIEILQHHMLN